MLRVSLLGEQVIADDATGTVLTRSPRSVALVAHLVVHAGRAQPRRLLAGLFWPDSTDAQALTNLRRELHQLRRVLGDPPSLTVTGQDLCWRDAPSSRVDVREFAVAHRAALAAEDPGEAVGHARAALTAYRGELLPGLADDWVLAARAELERQCVELCDLICRTPSGDPAAALAAARRRIALRPLEEPGYRTLMELQAAAGDRAGAVSTYHRCASVLEREALAHALVVGDGGGGEAVEELFAGVGEFDELGVVPAEPTRAALRRLLARPDPEPRRAAAPGLVGRAAEPARLGELWRTAAAGRAGLVLVRGDAGVGKTRLVSELAGPARAEGAIVAAGRCFAAPGRLALAPVADWLRTPAVRRRPQRGRAGRRRRRARHRPVEAAQHHGRPPSTTRSAPTPAAPGATSMHLYPIDGAASRVAPDATAFPHREGGWSGVIVGVDPAPENAEAIAQWTRDYWEELHPTSAGGAYVNFMMEEGQDRVRASYRGNYDRLAAVQRKYDPENAFHVNQNIRPA